MHTPTPTYTYLLYIYTHIGGLQMLCYIVGGLQVKMVEIRTTVIGGNMFPN